MSFFDSVHKFEEKAAPLTFAGGLFYSWSPINEWAITNAANGTYGHIGGLLGVAAASIVGGTASFIQQYPCARAANRVYDREGRFVSWVHRKLGSKESDDKGYEPKGLAERATTAFLLGTDAVTLNERRRGASADQGDYVALRTSASLAVAVGSLAAVAAGSSEVAKVFNDPVLADNIIAVASSWKTWLGFFALTRITPMVLDSDKPSGDAEPEEVGA